MRKLLAILLLPTLCFADTGATLKNDLRLRLGQTASTNSNWTDVQLYRILNQAQNHIASLGRVVENLDTLGGGSVTSEGVQRLAYPTNFVALRGNAYLMRNHVIVKPIPRVSVDTFSTFVGRMNSQDIGIDVFKIADEAGMLAVAPALRLEDSVVVSFYMYPLTLDSVTESGFSLEWEQALLLTAKVIALEKISSPDLPLAIAERDKLLAALYQSDRTRPQTEAK